MVERANVSFVCLGIFCFLLYIVVLAAPWFFLNEKIQDTDGNSAERTFLFSWRDVYCDDSGSANFTDAQCPDNQINWRTKCSEVFGDGECNDLEDTFNISGGLSGLSFFFFLIGFIIVSIVNVAGKGPARLSIVAIILYMMATALLAAALIQFPIMFPGAFKKVYPCDTNTARCPCSDTYDTNPCNMYMGTSNSNDAATGKFEFLWLSIGWIIAMFTCIIMIANTIQSVVGRRKGDADSDDY